MRIALDVTCAARAHRTGVGRAVEMLVRYLGAADTRNEYVLYYRMSRLRQMAYFLPLPGANFRQKLFQEPFTPFLSRQLDVFHGLDLRLPRFSRSKLVATIHDLFSILFDDLAALSFRERKKKQYRDLAQRADCIIAVSENTRKDFLDHFECDPNRVRVIYHGVSSEFVPQPEKTIEAFRKSRGLPSEYLLFIGSVNRRKNLNRIVETVAEVRKHFDIHLIVAGPLSYGHEEVKATVERTGLQEHVRFTGPVACNELPLYYAAARLFVWPSLYEGFGLPPLEAMACGTPVVTSNVSSLPEIVGDAALLVDPRNTQEISAAIITLLSDENKRRELIQRGIKRTKQFSWQENARKHIELYEELK